MLYNQIKKALKDKDLSFAAIEKQIHGKPTNNLSEQVKGWAMKLDRVISIAGLTAKIEPIELDKFVQIKKQYDEACNCFIEEFEKKQDIEFSYWVGGEIGGLACFIDEYFFNINDLILDLETKQPVGQILDWHNEGVDHNFFLKEYQHINYRSYIMGMRYSDLTKNSFEDEILP